MTGRDLVTSLREAAKMPKEKFMVDVALNEAADEIERLRLRKRPVAWVRYVCGTSQFQHASDAGDPPEDEGWIALYRRGE